MATYSEKPSNMDGAHLEEKHDHDSEPRQDSYVTDYTEAEKAAVIRKLDYRLLPFVFFLYMLAVLDRGNLGNAKLAGLGNTIDIVGIRYNWLGTAFYISYILFQWAQTGWKQFKPHQFCAVVVIGWGMVASLQAAAFNYSGLIVCRVFLAFFEACFGPGVPLYLTYFYPRDKVAFRHGVFISGAAMANAYGGALAYGITQIRGAIAPWRILFLIEGLPTILFGVVAWFVLPDSIKEARFLNAREREIARHFVSINQRADGTKRGVQLKELWAGLTDPKSILPALCYFGCNVSFASLPLFLPTIIQAIGAGHFDPATSNGLSAPPYLWCFFYIIAVCFASDHFGVRGPFCALSATCSGIGFIILATASSIGVRYFATFLAVMIFASVALLLAWVANIHNSESKRAGGYILLATVGQCGPLLGTNVFPASEGPRYMKGMAISASFSFLVAVLSGVLSCWLIWENRRMDREGVPEVVEYEGADEIGSGAAAQAARRKNRYIW